MKSILDAIARERNRQDEIHPEHPRYLCNPNDWKEHLNHLTKKLMEVRAENEKREATGKESWYGVMLEELLEIVTETNMRDMEKEAVQLAALCVRFVEELRTVKRKLP
jgi:uncharacterized coiled-coil protein SlyX